MNGFLIAMFLLIAAPARANDPLPNPARPLPSPGIHPGVTTPKTTSNPDNAFFGHDQLHTVRLTISPHAWELMQPTRRVRPINLFADSIPAPTTQPAAPAAPRAPESPRPKDTLYVEGEKLEPNNFGFEYAYVKARFECDGQTLADVGVRFKGNSSYDNFQRSPKRPFKLDFNRFADRQRFRGLASVNLNNNAFDPSLIREALAYEVYRLAGVPAPRTAFANVYLTVPGQYADQYLGVYTLIEEVDTGPFLKRSFGDAKGLLMKPEGIRGLPYMGESWAPYAERYRPKMSAPPALAARFVEFVKLLNYADDATFRARVGDYLDVDRFLRYLAATVLITNLDSPLVTQHNYYLYLSPKDGKLTYLPWDMNLSFATYGAMGGNAQTNLSITHPWGGNQKIFDRLLAIPEHDAAYRAHLRRAVQTFFNDPAMHRLIDRMTCTLADAPPDQDVGSGSMGGWWTSSRIPLKGYVTRRVESVLAQLEGEETNPYVPHANPGNLGFGWGLAAPREFGNLTAMAAAVRARADRDGDYRLTGREARDAAAALYFRAVDESHPEFLTLVELADTLDPLARAHNATRTRGGILSFGMGTEPGVLWARALFRSAGLRDDAKLTVPALTDAADRLFCLADRDQDGALDEREIAEALDLLAAPDRREETLTTGRRR